MSVKTVAVSEIVRLIKSSLEHNPMLQQVAMSGELSNVAISANGHWYFTLKDEKARLSCVMFSRAAQRIRTPFKEGDQVMVFGKISMYEASGSIQCYVSDLQLSGMGNLYVQLEQTRKKLAEEGLFNEHHKKSIPTYPTKIGLVCSNQTAAYHDVVSTLTRRWPMAQLVFHHTQVQGVEAIEQIKHALKVMDQQQVDVVLLVRGGGSIEDLWCFNDEGVVRTIFDMKTPIISGVGHESDITLVDYVVDQRAPTPTGAAEMATPTSDDVHFALSKARDSMMLLIQGKLDKANHQLQNAQSHRFFSDPSSLTSPYKNDLVLYRKRLEHSLSAYDYLNQQIRHDRHSITLAMDQRLKQAKEKVKHLHRYTQSLSIDQVLARGFSITKVNDTYVSSIHDVQANDTIETIVFDGVIQSDVIKKKEN